MRSRSSAVRYPHQAGEAYVSRATSCSAEVGMPRDRRVFRAYMDDEHDPKILLTWAETDSFSVTVIPRIFIEAAALIWFEMGGVVNPGQKMSHSFWIFFIFQMYSYMYVLYILGKFFFFIENRLLSNILLLK